MSRAESPPISSRPGRRRYSLSTRRLRRQFPELIELYDNTASLQDRTVGTGVVSAALAAQFAAPGYVGRASGRSFDARICLPYPPYDAAPIEIVVRPEGDVDARVWVRIREIQHSIGWLEAALASLPRGPVRLPVSTVPAASVEGSALVEGFRGDILAYVRIGPGRRIERCHLRDPVMVSVAAAGGRHRGQHRCGLSLVQQVVQLLLFRA